MSSHTPSASILALSCDKLTCSGDCTGGHSDAVVWCSSSGGGGIRK